MDDIEFLAEVPLFSACGQDELRTIAGLASTVTFKPEQIIVAQGTPGYAMYMITRGLVEVETDGVVATRLAEGEFFGEMSLLDDSPRTATVRALEDTDCMILSSWDLKAVLEKKPSIALNLLGHLSRRLRVAQRRNPGDAHDFAGE